MVITVSVGRHFLDGVKAVFWYSLTKYIVCICIHLLSERAPWSSFCGVRSLLRGDEANSEQAVIRCSPLGCNVVRALFTDERGAFPFSGRTAPISPVKRPLRNTLYPPSPRQGLTRDEVAVQLLVFVDDAFLYHF